MSTNGQKGKWKDVCLPLTDWVRGMERLEEPREHFLSWGLEQGKPILKVTSASEHHEFRINMNSEIHYLQVSSPNLRHLQVFYPRSMVARPRVLEHHRLSLNLVCIVYDRTPLLNSFSQVRIFLTALLLRLIRERIRWSARNDGLPGRHRGQSL